MPQLEVETYLPQITWLVITFTTLLLIMWRVALPRVADMLEARQRRIEDNLDKAAQLNKEAEAAREAYEKAIADAHAEAQGLINEARAEMAERAAKQQAELAERLAQQIDEAEGRIAEAKEQALGEIRSVSVELAGAAVEKLIGETPEKKAVAKAVDSAIKARRGA